MIPLKKTIYILSILFIANFAKGQDNILTLSTALEQALENNYGLIISRASLDVAEINNNQPGVRSVHGKHLYRDVFPGRGHTGRVNSYPTFLFFEIDVSFRRTFIDFTDAVLGA